MIDLPSHLPVHRSDQYPETLPMSFGLFAQSCSDMRNAGANGKIAVEVNEMETPKFVFCFKYKYDFFCHTDRVKIQFILLRSHAHAHRARAIALGFALLFGELVGAEATAHENGNVVRCRMLR